MTERTDALLLMLLRQPAVKSRRADVPVQLGADLDQSPGGPGPGPDRMRPSRIANEGFPLGVGYTVFFVPDQEVSYIV